MIEDEDELDDEHPKEKVVVIVFVDGIQLVELENEQDGVIVVGTQLVDEQSVGHDGHVVGVVILGVQDWLVVTVNGVQVVDKGITGQDGHVVGIEGLGEQDWLVVTVNGVQLPERLVVRIVGTQVVGFTVMLLQLWEAVTVVGGNTTGRVVVVVNGMHGVETGQKLGQ